MLIAITAVMTYEADAQPRCIYAVRSGFCQGVARDSVLSFGSSVRCGHRPYTEPLDSLGALANGR